MKREKLFREIGLIDENLIDAAAFAIDILSETYLDFSIAGNCLSNFN